MSTVYLEDWLLFEYSRLECLTSIDVTKNHFISFTWILN